MFDGVKLIVRFCTGLVPISTNIMIGKEKLFSSTIPRGHVKKATMRNKGLKTPVMHARQHKYRIPAVTSTNRSYSLRIHIRLFGQIIDTRYIIASTLTATVFGNILIPLDTPAGHPTTIRRNNNISLRG